MLGNETTSQMRLGAEQLRGIGVGTAGLNNIADRRERRTGEFFGDPFVGVRAVFHPVAWRLGRTPQAYPRTEPYSAVSEIE